MLRACCYILCPPRRVSDEETFRRSNQAKCIPRTRIQMPVIPSEFTRGIDTGVLLSIFVLYEVWNLRKYGITPSTVKSQVDHMGHLTGYFVGIGAGAIIRAKDPRWRDVERHHFFTEGFGKAEKPSSPEKSPG